MWCESYTIRKSENPRGVPENSLEKAWVAPRFGILAEIAISSGLVAYFGAIFVPSAALRALLSTNSRSTSGSWSSSRRVILHHARDLGNQRAKCDIVGPKLFTIFGRLFWHNSSFVSSFWLRLCVVRVLYHAQLSGHTRCCRKFIGESVGEGKVEHVDGNRDFE